MNILDETKRVITYSREMEKTTTEPQAANEQFKEVDRLKDDFISTVTHKPRAPSPRREPGRSSARQPGRRWGETSVIPFHSHSGERAAHALDHSALDFQKMEAGGMTW